MPNADPRVALPAGERQYHIGLGPGDLAEYILLPGDPDRTARIATRLENIEGSWQHREFASVTGTYRGERVSVVSTGIGSDNVEIVVAEILAITKRPTFIRVGSCGGLQPEIAIGDLIISSGSVRLEATTGFFVHDGYPAVADYEAVAALVEAAAKLGHRAHVGITATAPGFFGAQGRPIPSCPSATLTSPRRWRASASSTSRWRHRHCWSWPGWLAVGPGSSARSTRTDRRATSQSAKPGAALRTPASRPGSKGSGTSPRWIAKSGA